MQYISFHMYLLVLHCVGWWMVDANGKIGWAPASYLVPVDEGDLAEEAKERDVANPHARIQSS